MRKKKNTKNGISAATKRALGVRGGFRKGWAGHFGDFWKTYKDSAGPALTALFNNAKDASAKYAASQTVDKFSDSWRKIAGTKGAFVFENPTKKGIARKTQPGFTDTSIVRLTGSNAIFKSKKYKTLIEFGKKPSKAVNMLKTMNGTTTETQFNTSDGDTPASTLAPFTNQFGFNQKLLFFPPQEAVVTQQNVLDLFGDAQQSQQGRYMYYGMCTREEVTYRIYNSNSYFPIKCKVSLCTMHEDLSANALLFRMVNNLPTQSDDSFPVLWQFGALDVDNTSVLVHPKTGLTQAGAFRESSSISRTESVKIAPGDIWEIKFVYHTGPGWDILRAKSASLDNAAGQPKMWFPVFQFHGVDCEAIEDATGRRIIGTSPGTLNIDVKKRFEFINQSATNATQNVVGNPTRRMVRTFRDDQQAFQAELANFPANQVQPGPGLGGVYIPVISDKEQKFATPTGS